MRKFLCLIGAVFSLIAAVAFAADQPGAAQVGAEQSGESSIHVSKTKDGCWNTDVTDVRFTPTTVSDGMRSMKLVLRSTFEQHEADCRDAIDGKVSVEATAYDDDFKTGTKLWSISTPGWTGEESSDPDGQFYKVSMPGCCGSSDTDIYFSLLNGKRLLIATEPLLDIHLIQGDFIKGNMFVALQDNTSSLQGGFTATADSKDVIAVVSMASDQQPGESVVIHREGDYCHPNDLMLTVDGKVAPRASVDQDLFHSASAPKAGHGLFVRGKLDCLSNGGGEYIVDFEIPIVGGHLAASGAKSKDPKVGFSPGKV